MERLGGLRLLDLQFHHTIVIIKTTGMKTGTKPNGQKLMVYNPPQLWSSDFHQRCHYK